MAPPPGDRPKGPAYELLLDMGPGHAQLNEPLLPVVQDRVHESSRKRASATGGASDGRKLPVAPSRVAQPPGQARQKDKFVPLPSGLATSGDLDEGEGESGGEGGESWLAPQAEAGPVKSRVTAYCVAESFDRPRLEELLQQLYVGKGLGYTISYSDVVHLALGPPSGASPRMDSNHSTEGPVLATVPVPAKRKWAPQDVFFFNYGVVIMFGLDKQMEQDVLKQVAFNVQLKPYSASLREVDEFQVQDSAAEPPHIKNDIFTINKRQAKMDTVRLSIAYALAQSSKLSVHEEQVWDLVEATKHLPEIMAQTGKVAVSPKTVTRLIGKVFLQAANVNLVSSVLDTPPFFWSAPDHLQALYERACEYLELEARVEVLNTRFQVLQELLDMLRNQQNNYHASRLEVIIIWLLVVDCILMLCQLLSLFGIVGQSVI